jgi:lysophospholipase L1-like esterase
VAIDARLADPTNRRYYADDGMHLTDEGYTAMGEIVAGVLAKNGE